MSAPPLTPGDALREALAAQVLHAPWVVLAGGGFSARHRLLQDALEPLVFREATAGDIYRGGARRIALRQPDLRRGAWDALDAEVHATRSEDGRRVVLIEEAHALLRMGPVERARITQRLVEVVAAGGDVCVLLATDEHALHELAALFEGAWDARSVVRIPPAAWPRQVVWAAALLTSSAGVVWGVSLGRSRASAREVGAQRATSRAALPSLHDALASRASPDEQRAIAAAMAEIELRAGGGAGEGASRLIDDRGAGWAGGPWVLRGAHVQVLTVRYLADGALLVAEPGRARVLDARDGRELRGFPSGDDATSARVSDDLRRLVTSDREHVRVWDLATGHLRWASPARGAAASLSGDGARVALLQGRSVTVIDVDADRVLARGTSPGPSDRVEISADGLWLYAIGPRSEFGGSVFASARLTTELRWNGIPPTPRGLLSLRENHAIRIEADPRGGPVDRLLDAEGATVRRLDGMTLASGRVSADGRRFLGRGEQLHVIDARRGERLATIPIYGDDARGMDDRGELVLGEGPFGAGHVWGVAQQRWVGAISLHDDWADLTTNPLDPEELVRFDARVGVARWRCSPGTRRLGRAQIALEPADDPAVLSRAARLLGDDRVEVTTVANGANPTRRCFDVARAAPTACPAEEARGANDATLSLLDAGSAISVGDGRALQHGLDRGLTLRDVRQGRALVHLGRVDPFAGGAFGARAALRSERPRTVRLAADHGRGLHFTERSALRVWDARTGRHLASIVPVSGARFVDAAFTRDARQVVTLDARGVVERWHLRPEDPRALLAEHLAETNLRVCPGDLRVVVVAPPLDAATLRSPWAPARACASGQRITRARVTAQRRPARTTSSTTGT